MLIDTHSHLDFSDFDSDRDEVIKRALDNGVNQIINVGSSIAGSERSLKLSLEYPGVYPVVGIPPHEADGFDASMEESLSGLAKNNKVVGIGETGLDYFRNHSKKASQLRLFYFQIGLAKRLNLPLVIHTRQAGADTLRVLKEAMPLCGVVHCFSGDRDFLEAILNLGLLVSFTCNITYKKSQDLRDMVRAVPLKKLMLETDCPYLSPEGFRGKRNEPMQVKLLAEFIAGIKNLSPEEVAGQTTQNAADLFALPKV